MSHFTGTEFYAKRQKCNRRYNIAVELYNIPLFWVSTAHSNNPVSCYCFIYKGIKISKLVSISAIVRTFCGVESPLPGPKFSNVTSFLRLFSRYSPCLSLSLSDFSCFLDQGDGGRTREQASTPFLVFHKLSARRIVISRTIENFFLFCMYHYFIMVWKIKFVT